nr:mfs gliotoxin efflux transporter glia [Quercus suber]
MSTAIPAADGTASEHEPELKSGQETGSTAQTSDLDEKDHSLAVVEENAAEPGPNASHPSPEYPATGRLVLILVAVAMSVFLVALDTSIVSTAIPAITDEFHSLDDVGWYGSGFFITTAAFQSLWGKAYKYWSIKMLYLLAMFIFEIGSLICALAPSSVALIVGRAIAGIGGAGLAAGTYLIVALSAPPERVPSLQGVVAASFAIASVVGPLLGGVFTTQLVLVNLPIGGFTFAIVTFFFRTPAHAVKTKASWKEKIFQMDLLGMVLVLGSVICILLALQWGGTTKAWSSAPVIGTLVGFVVIAIAFIALEIYLGERAALNIRLLKNRTMALLMAYQFFINGAFFILLYYLPIYFQSVKGVSASQSGVRTIPLVIPTALFAIVCGVLISVTGEYQAIMIVGTSLATIGSGLIYTLTAASGSGMWIGYQVLCGVGLGLAAQLAVIVAQAISTRDDLSTASAMAIFFQLLGGAVWISVAQAIFENRLIQSLTAQIPGLSMESIVSAGATGITTILTPDQLPAALSSFLNGLHATFALCIAVAGTAVVLSLSSLVFNRRKLDLSAAAAAAAAGA